jgi:hypothetical protein
MANPLNVPRTMSLTMLTASCRDSGLPAMVTRVGSQDWSICGGRVWMGDDVMGRVEGCRPEKKGAWLAAPAHPPVSWLLCTAEAT